MCSTKAPNSRRSAVPISKSRSSMTSACSMGAMAKNGKAAHALRLTIGPRLRNYGNPPDRTNWQSAVTCAAPLEKLSARKQQMRRLADASAPERREWLARAQFFHGEDLLYLKFLINEGARVLELGCGTGDL